MKSVQSIIKNNKQCPLKHKEKGWVVETNDCETIWYKTFDSVEKKITFTLEFISFQNRKFILSKRWES